MSKTTKLHLLDKENDCTIKSRTKPVFVTKTVDRIFLTNNLNDIMLDKKNELINELIRRCLMINFDQSLIKGGKRKKKIHRKEVVF
jgi:hypothetical protein